MRDAALIRKRSLLGRLGQFRSRKCLPAVLHDEYSFDIYGWVTASSGEVQASQRFGGGRLSYFPAHTWGQKVLVVTKRISSWMQAVKVRFLLRVCGHNLGITVTWSVVCASQGDQKKEVWASLPRLLPDTLYRMDRWTSYSNYYPNMSFRTLQGHNIVAWVSGLSLFMCITAHRASGLHSFVIYFHIHKVFVLQSKNKVGCPVGISFYIIGRFFLISLNRKKAELWIYSSTGTV